MAKEGHQLEEQLQRATVEIGTSQGQAQLLNDDSYPRSSGFDAINQKCRVWLSSLAEILLDKSR
eukprot:6859933-Prorocentrum_lima.AAC.1